MQGQRVLTVSGIDIEINSTWVILFVLLVVSIAQAVAPQALPGYSTATHWVAGLAVTLVLVLSLVMHELAHSLMAKRLGMRVSRITLFVFGGVSQMEDEPRTGVAEFTMAIVGPATSLAIGSLCLLLARALTPGESLVWFVLWYAGRVNFILAAFNMLPGFPLDGGRVLRAILWSSSGSLDWATRIASKAGQVVGFLLIGLGILQFFTGLGVSGLWLVALGWLLSNAAAESYNRLRVERALGGVTVGQIMSAPVITIPAGATLDEAVGSYFVPLRHATFPVERDGSLIGVVALESIGQVPRDQWSERLVGEVIEPLDHEAMMINVGSDAVHAMMKMAENRRGGLIVVDQTGGVVGIVSQTDIAGLLRVKTGLGV